LTAAATDRWDPQQSISLRISGGADAPLSARRSVLSQMGAQLSETNAADLALIISELVTNSVLHARVGPEETVSVECTRLPDRLRITVTDPGARSEPHLRAADPRLGGGYGLRIVAELALAWGVVHDAVGATSVWCELASESHLPAAG
jgi:anti-sigma regulatory factor (Ser/Thr protein kinase)